MIICIIIFTKFILLVCVVHTAHTYNKNEYNILYNELFYIIGLNVYFRSKNHENRLSKSINS